MFYYLHDPSVERMLGGNVNLIIWDQFKKSFYTKFFYVNLRDAKRQEFLGLKQGYILVEEYDQLFDMLSRSLLSWLILNLLDQRGLYLWFYLTLAHLIHLYLQYL